MEKDFDFEKELGFDPDALLSDDGFDADIDLSEFSDEELDLTGQDPAEDSNDLDLSDLDALLGKAFSDEDAFDEDDEEDEPAPRNASPAQDDDDALLRELEEFSDGPDFPDGMFGQKASIYHNAPEDTQEPDTFQDEELPETDFAEEEIPQEEAPQEDEQPERPRRERRPRAPRKPKVPREHKPNVFTKLFDLYFGPVLNKEQQEQPVDPANPRRRRRKSKQQIFKEVYLPPIIACVALILMMSFVIGAISNAIDQKRLSDTQKENQLQESLNQAEQEQAEYQRVMEQATKLAQAYNFDDAIQVLENFSGYANYPEMATKRAEYVSTRDSMVEYKDPSTLPNLSFHPLIVDTVRAFADKENGASYNKNFVTVDEFRKILDELYSNGYVLVDFDSFVSVSQTVSGDDQFLPVSILLPEGKKPVMLTQTLLNYYLYMVDSNDDLVPDAGGAGFANKLVVDASGNIQAEYVDASGNTLTGAYDLVPILEEFIAAHPDFSYKGARAILATTGDQGIFGYRCNTSYIATKGNDYYEQQKAGAITLVNALKEKGYTLASYTYKNDSYRQLNATQINADLASWTQYVTPIIGDIDVFVYARGVDLSDYSGAAFKAMYQTGFRYFIGSGKSPSTSVNNTYVHQDRLMVTGENMCWYSDRFTSLFDCNRVLDLTARGGSVPKSG